MLPDLLDDVLRLVHVFRHVRRCVKTGACFQTGWMMWNWMVSALFVGAAIVCYDGSPFVPNENVLWDLTDKIGYVLLFYLQGHYFCDTLTAFFSAYPGVEINFKEHIPF